MGKNLDHVAEAKRILAEHEYTLIASGANCEVWYCAKPGTSIFAFDIIVTRMGMAVVGDINGLVFQVGANYGIPFLAGDDISYYIHSKLEAICKTTEFVPEKLKYHIAHWISSYYQGRTDEWKDRGITVPEWLEDGEAEEGNWDELKLILETAKDTEDTLSPQWDELDECIHLMDNAEDVSDEHDAYQLLSSFEVFHFDLCDITITKPSESLMLRLHLVNEAAKKILEQKQTA
jgi:hypothetical protein